MMTLLRCCRMVLLAWLSVAACAQQAPRPQPAMQPGSITGMVNDVGGAPVPGARVTLTRLGSPEHRDAITDASGGFTFTGVVAGAFKLDIVEEGLEPGVATGTLHPGQTFQVQNIALKIATAEANVEVTVSSFEIAEAEIKQEEKQRVLGIVPNFFVSYVSDPAPLKAKQKFKLALRVTRDPTTFLFAGIAAGIEQADNTFPGYNQGAEGYGKRYGAALANDVSATFLRGAILPSLLRQDPRFFYKADGTIWQRARYALATAVICKGDNRRWQPNYSGIGGDLAAGALANLYYPASSRHGVALTFEDGLISTAGVGVGHLIQEFVFRRLTPNIPKVEPSNTAPSQHP